MGICIVLCHHMLIDSPGPKVLSLIGDRRFSVFFANWKSKCVSNYSTGFCNDFYHIVVNGWIWRFTVKPGWLRLKISERDKARTWCWLTTIQGFECGLMTRCCFLFLFVGWFLVVGCCRRGGCCCCCCCKCYKLRVVSSM